MQKLNEFFSGRGDGDGTTDSFLEDGSEGLCSLSTTQRINGFAASLAAGLLLMFLAEKKSREESERLRLRERENLTEKRRRDLTLRVRVAAKAEQKKLQLLFLQWSEHQKKLTNFIRLFLISVPKCAYSQFYRGKDKFPFTCIQC